MGLAPDQLGSTSITANSSGTKVAELRYDAWGSVRYTNSTTPTDYTYTGQYSNVADFGLMYYNARWYDPTIARFIQADTIVPEGVQGWDRYAYALNNPVRYTDPSGHCVLVDEDAHGLCVLTKQQSSSTGIQVVHGGSVFPNRVEVGLANTYLTGQSKWLCPILPSPFLRLGMQRAGCQLGEQTCADPRLLLIAAMFRPGYPFDDEYVPVPPDMGDPDRPGYGYVNPFADPRTVLYPGGVPVGAPTRGTPNIWTVQSVGQMERIFRALIVNAEPYAPKNPYQGTMYKLPGGGTVGWRDYSSSGGPAIDINIPGIDEVKEIHLP